MASVVLFLVFYWLNGLAWWLLVRGVRLRAGLHDSVAVWGQSILARYVPGNVFMFVGRALLAQRRGLALEPIGAAMVYEQALAFAAALVTAAALFPFAHDEPAAALWGLVGIPVILVALHPRVFSPVVGRLLRLLRRPPLDAGASLSARCSRCSPSTSSSGWSPAPRRTRSRRGSRTRAATPWCR